MKSSKQRKAKTNACPCGSEQSYDDCCGKYHSGVLTPKTAEQCMRSRYSAYVNELTPYLMNSWHASTRPGELELEPTKWIGLKIIATKAGMDTDTEGWVEFEARYKVNGKAFKLREKSYFVRETHTWFYVRGIE